MSTILVTDLLKDSKMPFEREREKISFTTFDVWHISCAPQLERLNSLEWKYLSKGAGLAKTVK
jgi:hypothetical protein